MAAAQPGPCARLFLAARLFGLLCLAGCSSLPVIAPDLSRRPGPPVQIEGARGPLSAAQKQGHPRQAAQPRGGHEHLERHLALEEAIVGSPLTTGNRVLLLHDGPATYQAMLAAIAQARDHINMEPYILEDDDVGQRFAQALPSSRSSPQAAFGCSSSTPSTPWRHASRGS